MNKRSWLVLSIASALLLPAGSASAAAHHSCLKRGYSIEFRNSKYALLERKVRDKEYEDGGYYNSYVCSRAYGRLVHVGANGTSGDGPGWSSVEAVNDRYAAIVDGYGGNAGGDTDTNVSVYDLKTGRKATDSGSSETEGVYEQYVSTVELASNGSVAWTTNYVTEDESFRQVEELWMRRVRGGKHPVLLSSGFKPVIHVMRWSADSKALLWTNAPRSFQYVPRKSRRSDPLQGGRCTGRPGDRIISRGQDYVYLSRSFKAPGWSHGRVLIACSLNFKRRVAIAHSGTIDGVTYTWDRPTVTYQYAGVVTRVTDAQKKQIVTLMSYDLGNEERVCRTEIARAAQNVKVPRVELDFYGTLIWIAQGALDAGKPATTELGICDDKSARRLFQSETLDESTLRLDDTTDRILVADRLVTTRGAAAFTAK